MNLCIKYGMALERWKVIHNTMLEKKVGNDRLDKLRVIHIFEADFNLIMGIMWGRRMIQNALDNDQVSPYQWGFCPGKQTGEPLLLKVLSFEIAAYTRTSSLVAIDKDCTSCFNRIVSCFCRPMRSTLGRHKRTLYDAGASTRRSSLLGQDQTRRIATNLSEHNGLSIARTRTRKQKGTSDMDEHLFQSNEHSG